MCKQRVERNEEYTASDFFYSAIVVLVERGLLHGRITRNYKKTQGNGDLATRNLDWAENGKKLALRIGLCCECKKKVQWYVNKLLSQTVTVEIIQLKI